MQNRSIVDEWFLIALDDYTTAKFLFEHMHRKPLEIICYHCQQCAEKAIKGYLCANGIAIAKTHFVGKFCRKCAEIDREFSRYNDACESLTIYATETRYPLRLEISESDVTLALKQAREIYEFAKEKTLMLLEHHQDEPPGMTMQ